MAMMQNIFNSHHFSRILRFVGYVILNLILFVSTITEIHVELKHLLLIPFVVFVLLYESLVLKKIEYHFGKTVRKNVQFIIDVALVTLYVAAMHALLIPTLTILGALIFTAVFGRINKLVLIISPIVSLLVFYLSSFFVFGFQPYLDVTSRELNILSIFAFMLFIFMGMYYQVRQSHILSQEKQYYMEETNRYLKLNNQLARYAPMQLWQSIMRGELEAKVEYKRRKLTVFFSDIQGFTDLSEKLIPDDLAFLLNDYLKHMTEIAKNYGGTIDKFMGDGMLIFFGDPTSRGVKEDAIACLDMAVAMRQQMRILRERWIKMGYASLHIRMGIATGYCHVGNYGTIHRMSYTIVGRDANLASRLQTAAEVDQILISEETFNLVKEQFLCIKNQPMKLKGITEFVRSWQVVERYNEAVDKYQRWYDYEYKGFNLLLNLDKTTIYEYPQLINAMEQTIERLKLQQKRTDDDGVVVLSEKSIIRLPNENNKDDKTKS
ncbi:adenylate/guanylate cyclase domain-containing protein [Acinetobacter populi]|uniref:Adenylate/guanylate cyclase domain-containing protein n=1 Tax=Acinetobacter populi TaxID=1582270 RepID=A0A1Z9YYX2_9GAMM|nr:adenylate/guanylate cyclase domain-containing protein [Acinetobacter populi]OUY07388.1 adenylate/guanylate cyclase domain-containing protein [Acinetobacter populi]